MRIFCPNDSATIHSSINEEEYEVSGRQLGADQTNQATPMYFRVLPLA